MYYKNIKMQKASFHRNNRILFSLAKIRLCLFICFLILIVILPNNSYSQEKKIVKDKGAMIIKNDLKNIIYFIEVDDGYYEIETKEEYDKIEINNEIDIINLKKININKPLKRKK